MSDEQSRKDEMKEILDSIHNLQQQVISSGMKRDNKLQVIKDLSDAGMKVYSEIAGDEPATEAKQNKRSSW